MFSRFITFLLPVFLLIGCASFAGSGDMGFLTPTPTPDPFIQYRGALQPYARTDIETAGPLPRYHIKAQLNKAKTILSGTMQVVIPSPEPELIFRLYPNTQIYGAHTKVTQAKLNGIPVEITTIAQDTAIQLTLPSPTELPSNTDAVTVNLKFTVQLNKTTPNKEALTFFGWNGPILSLPGFYPTLAVKQGNQWILDNPPEHGDVLFNEVALYQLELTLPKEMVVASSGVTLNVTNNANGNRTWKIIGGPLRDMTLVAGPFLTVSESAAGATVTSYYLPRHETAGLSALAHATASLRLYSDSFGLYPYTKLDVVEAPLGNRGMEYSSLILIGTNLYDEQREFLTFLVAHETAHQWWYAVVGNNPYQHPWLDEGLTEYSAFDYYRGVFGQDAAEQLLMGRWQIPFDTAAADGLFGGKIDRPAADFDPVSYELLVYSKAALFFNALREELGEELYKTFIKTYYAENRYRIVTPQTLLATAERVSGKNLNPLAEKWLK